MGNEVKKILTGLLLLQILFQFVSLHAAEDENELKKTIVPVLMYSNSAGLGSGAYVMLRRNYKKTFKLDKYSLAGIFTTEKQIMTFASLDKYIMQSFKMKARISYRDKPSTIYLPGHNSTFTDHADYNLQEFSISLYPTIEKGIFEVGPAVNYSLFDISEREEDREYIFDCIDGSDDYVLFGYGTRISADTRDNDNYPLTGYYWETEFLNFDKSLYGDFSFQVFESDLRYFFNISGIVIASQYYSKLTWGETPVHKMPSMGSNDIMRGISSKRYKDMDMMVFQSEIRYPLFRKFSGTIFAGIGNVASKIENLEIGTLKVAFGMGLRYAVSSDDRLNLRLDMGSNNRVSSNKDDDLFNIYFSIGEAF